MTLGSIIKTYRTEHDMSMDKFSEISGLSKSYISMLEKNHDQRGNIINPSIECIKKVANVTGKSFNDIFNILDDNVTFADSHRQTVYYLDDETATVIEAYKNASEEVKNIVKYALKVDKGESNYV